MEHLLFDIMDKHWRDVPFSVNEESLDRVGEFNPKDPDHIKSFLDVMSYVGNRRYPEDNGEYYTHLHHGEDTMMRLLNTISKLQSEGVL